MICEWLIPLTYPPEDASSGANIEDCTVSCWSPFWRLHCLLSKPYVAAFVSGLINVVPAFWVLVLKEGFTSCSDGMCFWPTHDYSWTEEVQSKLKLQIQTRMNKTWPVNSGMRCSLHFAKAMDETFHLHDWLKVHYCGAGHIVMDIVQANMRCLYV